MSNRERTKALFQGKAQDWHLKYNADGAHVSRLNDIVERLGKGRGRSLLDFGCASGNIAGALSSQGFVVTGCDISEGMVEDARRRFGDCVEILLIEEGSLPFDDESFDVVITVSVLEYVDEIAMTLTELARILKKDGLLLATVPNERHPVRWMEAALRLVMPSFDYSRIPLVSSAGSRLNSYRAYLSVSRQRMSRSGWARALERSGLGDVEIKPLPSRRTMLPVTATDTASTVVGRTRLGWST